jgi:hypothetical protein
MGKQTRMHPLPLSVLRGALEYCGWSFKSLRFVPRGERLDSALYKISKLQPPRDAPRMDVHAVKMHLEKCFTNQVKIQGVTHNTNTGLEAWIRVYTHPQDQLPLERALSPITDLS